MSPRPLPPVHVVLASADYREAFVAAVQRSRPLHAPWVQPPDTLEAFDAYLNKRDGQRNLGFFVLSTDHQLVGVVNVNEIVRGGFQSGYLGYYGFVPHAGRGFMAAGLTQVLGLAFHTHRLHRVEANIQPDNTSSLALVRRLGFRREGYSPQYLKIRERWRDHERWALTQSDWQPLA